MKLEVISYVFDEFTIVDENDKVVAHVHHPTLAYQMVAALEIVEQVPVLISALAYLEIEAALTEEVEGALFAVLAIVERLKEEITHATDNNNRGPL